MLTATETNRIDVGHSPTGQCFDWDRWQLMCLSRHHLATIQLEKCTDCLGALDFDRIAAEVKPGDATGVQLRKDVSKW